MVFRGFMTACLAGALLLTAGCTNDKPKMEVPDTNKITFTHTETEEWKNAEQQPAAPPVRQEVQLAAGGSAMLYAFDTGEVPIAGADEITSVGEGLVLNSTAVRLGEHGTTRELAESELYHWADAGEFDAIEYTHPAEAGEGRYVVHLKLSNAQVGMEQQVVYTTLDSGVARVDRLWRAIADAQADAGSAEFDRMAAYLRNH